MTIKLTSELAEFIAEQVKTGRYRSAEDVIAQSLELLRAQEGFIQLHTDELRQKISVGMEQIKRGEVVDGRKAIDRLREKIRNRPRSRE